MAGDFGFEVVVVRFGRQFCKHLHPDRFRYEQPEGVIGPSMLLNLALVEKVGEAFLESF